MKLKTLFLVVLGILAAGVAMLYIFAPVSQLEVTHYLDREN